jgi:hypothetical protein
MQIPTKHITRETERALKVEVFRNAAGHNTLVRREVWLPKSQVEIAGGQIHVPGWLVRDRDLGLWI